jgi:beta-phosphoglucomutase family hydrolase
MLATGPTRRTILTPLAAHSSAWWSGTANYSATESEDPVLGLPDKVRACLFDLDGVLTDTASVHTKAWKAMFDAYLSQRAERTGDKFVPFDAAADYRQYVDGKKREDGVKSFLDSRGIQLPEGNPDDSGDAETIYSLGNRKNDMFQKVLEKDGVEVFDGSRRYLEAVSAAGLGIAVVSASANTPEVLKITGLDRFIQQRVDGNTLREEHLPGKPAPDSFLRGAQLLDVPPDAAAVFEDALAGVAAGRAGNFGCVVGVDRVGQAEGLRKSGADVVVTDLAELLQP